MSKKNAPKILSSAARRRCFGKTKAVAMAGTLMSALFVGSVSVSAKPALQAEIRWTEYGVPHVRAKDYAGLGYGYGYASAKNQYCLIADHLITLRGERSRHFGRDGMATVGFLPTTNINADLFYRLQLSQAVTDRAAAQLNSDARELARGYAAGLNRFVTENSEGNVGQSCNLSFEPEFTESDVIRAALAVGVIWNAFHVAPFTEASVWGAQSDQVAAVTPPVQDVIPSGIGSNVWAYGGDVVAEGDGAFVIANPHTRWGKHWLRLHQMHLTIADEIDVAGAGFLGLPLPVVGFTKDMAWSIQAPSTVGFYVLQKREVDSEGSNPTYVVDGERFPISFRDIDIEVADENGSVQTETFKFAMAGGSPVYRLPEGPGRPEGWYTVTDAGESAAGAYNQFLGLSRADNVDQARDVIADNRGLGAHVVAGDRSGGVLYIEAGPMLAVSDQRLQDCRLSSVSAPNILDGTRSACGLRTQSGAPDLLEEDGFPTIVSRGIVQNTNNSYLHSEYGIVQEPRSVLFGDPRAGRADLRLEMSERRLGEVVADEMVSFDEARAVVMDNRNFAAETWLDQILEVCKSNGDEQVRSACVVLAGWDRRNDRDSRGTLLFQQLWSRIFANPSIRPAYDPAQPFVYTPLSLDDQGTVVLVAALKEAVTVIESAGLQIDAPWGSVLRHASTSEGAVPLHGGNVDAGVLNSLGGVGLTSDGYAQIAAGTAYLQFVRWDDAGVQADVVLAHGQSSDPASPHYFDQIDRYSDQSLWRFPFDRDAVEAETVEIRVLSDQDQRATKLSD
ncbi:penicillin acylase family protein [Parasphingorhabdus sp.]|uniref:penicillin acylase family protein n=1 Tax=Parasphingorhabdus sp. TaxID=2709688 RepID=UPI0032658F75